MSKELTEEQIQVLTEQFKKINDDLDRLGLDYILLIDIGKDPDTGKSGFNLFSNIQDGNYIGFIIKQIASQIQLKSPDKPN